MDTPAEAVHELVRKTVERLERDTEPLSAIVRACIRIAKLRDDYINLWWLQWELSEYDDHENRRLAFRDAISHLTEERLNFGNTPLMSVGSLSAVLDARRKRAIRTFRLFR